MRVLFLGVVLAASAARPAPAEQNFDSASELSALFKKYHFKKGLVRKPKGVLKHRYLVPQHAHKKPYYQLFDWDIYFLAAALGRPAAKPLADSVKNFLDQVDNNSFAEGYSPREIAPEGYWALPEMVKPFLAQEAWLSSQQTGNYRWTLPYYERLKHTLSYWETARRAPDGLFVWFNGEESGADNNPAVSDEPSGVTEGVDLQVYLVREYRAFAALADRLGRPEDAKTAREKADALAERVRTLMWSEADLMFLNIDSRTGRKVPIKTWSNFTPLWEGIATEEQARLTVERHLLNPAEFWSPHGVRTVSKDEKTYDPKEGYWRGPVWVVSNYILMRGLLNYGYRSQARELAANTVSVLVDDIRKTKGMNECYNPETGEPTAAGDFIDWDLLGERMPDEAAGGPDPMALPR